MEIIQTKDYECVSDKAFEILKDVVVKRPTAVLGLATGSTPLGLYARMAADFREKGTSYKEVTTVNLDEYVSLAPSHPQSYAYFMRKQLFDHVDVDPKNTYIEDGTADDIEAECARYNAVLDAHPRDLQILGIGSNGHIAFNEPGTPFAWRTHRVALANSTIRDNARLFEHEDDVPRYALTMGIADIMTARKIVILATGAGKADAVQKLVHGEVTQDFPASILQRHADCTLICDRLAAAKL